MVPERLLGSIAPSAPPQGSLSRGIDSHMTVCICVQEEQMSVFVLLVVMARRRGAYQIDVGAFKVEEEVEDGW